MENTTIPVDAWLEEKLVKSLVSLSRAAWYAKRLSEMDPESELPPYEMGERAFITAGLYDEIYCSLYDLTKVASHLHGGRAEWRPGDREEILDKGEEGLANVLERYALSGWLPYFKLRTSDELTREKAADQAILNHVRELAEGERENRTEIHSELHKIEGRDAKARLILDLLEPVTQGEKDWGEFQEEMRRLPADD